MSVPPADFDALVRDALEHLYDVAYLRGHPLTRALLPRQPSAGAGGTLALRQVLLDTIDAMSLGGGAPPGTPQGRGRQILQLRYVEALPFREVASRLGLSQAQYYRDLRHALEAYATLLWEEGHRLGAWSGEPAVDRAGEPTEGALPFPPYGEVEAATHQAEALTDLGDVVAGVVGLLRQTAASRGVEVRALRPADPVLTRGSRTALRQLAITAAGYVLGGGRGGQLTLSSSGAGGTATLNVVYEGGVSEAGLRTPRAVERLGVMRQLAQSLRGALSVERLAGGIAIAVEIGTQGRTVLVIDDNPDVVQFVGRLIADQPHTVLSAQSVGDGLALARTARPDVVLVDIMLPGQDGWDALQALKHDPATQEIPVLVCTVLDESELALALGAAGFIRKPLTRQALLEALARWASPPPQPGGGRRRSSSSGPEAG